MPRKARPSELPKQGDISRRQFLKTGLGVAALPFALIIPSNAAAVVTTEERLRPFTERQTGFDRELREKIAQIPGRPLPPPPPRPIPPPIKVNTRDQKSTSTPGTEATFSGTPPRSDDTRNVTIFDQMDEYWRSDER